MKRGQSSPEPGPSQPPSPAHSPSAASPLMGRAADFRSVSLPKEEWMELTGGLYRISVRAGGSQAAPSAAFGASAAAAGAHTPPPPQQQHPSPAAAVAVQLDGGPWTPRGSISIDPPRSIFRLPVVSCRSRAYTSWVLAVLLLDLTYSAFLLPLSIGFQVNDLSLRSWACFVDLAAGACFAAELFLGFHVSYLASNGGQRREVSGGRQVAHFYIRHGSFWQDLISTAVWVTQIVLLLVQHAGGVELKDSAAAFQYIRIVRMVRFLTVLRQMFMLTVGAGGGTVVPGLRIPTRLAHALNIAYSSAVLLHFFACLWNFIAIKEGLEGTWLNTVAALVRRHAADGASPLTAAEAEGIPGAERYVVGLYFSAVTIATLGYGDVVPVNSAEYLVAVAMIASGVLLFGLAMGSLAEVVSSSSKEARQAQIFRDKIESVNAWLHTAVVSRPLKQRIRAYYSDVWLRHAATHRNVGEQFRELPHALRQEVAWELNRKLLTRLRLFRELTDAQRYALAGMLAPMDVTPGQELCLHGDPADRIWLLVEGEVQVFDEVGTVRSVAAPAVLGSEALLQHVEPDCATRPYGYRTATACTLWEAHLDELLPFLLANVGVLDALSAAAQLQREAEAAAEEAVSVAAAAELAAQQAAVVAGGAAGASFAGVATVTADGLQWMQVNADGSSREAAAADAVAEADRGGATTQAQAGRCWTPGAASLGALPTGSGTAEVPPACAEDAGAPATKGEMFQLCGEVVGRLDSLATEMRRAIAAATLAHSVAAMGGGGYAGRSHGGSPRARRPYSRADSMPPVSSAGAAAPRRMQWSYGQLHAAHSP